MTPIYAHEPATSKENPMKTAASNRNIIWDKG